MGHTKKYLKKNTFKPFTKNRLLPRELPPKLSLSMRIFQQLCPLMKLSKVTHIIHWETKTSSRKEIHWGSWNHQMWTM